MTSIPSQRKTKEKKPKKKSTGRGSSSPFNAAQVLSPDLATLLGVSELSRPQVVKRIWDYIKAKGLQDPSNKQFILCDEPLKHVFKVGRLSMFKMNSVSLLIRF
jgi:upstream activation factor subunit UAF30